VGRWWAGLVACPSREVRARDSVIDYETADLRRIKVGIESNQRLRERSHSIDRAERHPGAALAPLTDRASSESHRAAEPKRLGAPRLVSLSTSRLLQQEQLLGCSSCN
jgi:hypothetical protein